MNGSPLFLSSLNLFLSCLISSLFSLPGTFKLENAITKSSTFGILSTLRFIELTRDTSSERASLPLLRGPTRAHLAIAFLIPMSPPRCLGSHLLLWLATQFSRCSHFKSRVVTRVELVSVPTSCSFLSVPGILAPNAFFCFLRPIGRGGPPTRGDWVTAPSSVGAAGVNSMVEGFSNSALLRCPNISLSIERFSSVRVSG